MLDFYHVPSEQVASYLPKLIELRAVVYRDYPYLYEQNLDDEWEYVSQYSGSRNTVLIAAKRDDGVIGMIIGLPLSESQDWIRGAFSGNLDGIFYVGDIATMEKSTRTELLNERRCCINEPQS